MTPVDILICVAVITLMLLVMFYYIPMGFAVIARKYPGFEWWGYLILTFSTGLIGAIVMACMLRRMNRRSNAYG